MIIQTDLFKTNSQTSILRSNFGTSTQQSILLERPVTCIV